MIQPSLRDSRRIPGLSIFHPGPGVVIDIACADRDRAELIRLWQHEAARILEAVDWADAPRHALSFPGGASLFFAAPIDCLYSATEVNEWAWEAALRRFTRQPPPSLSEGAEKLRARIAGEAQPKLVQLARQAQRAGVSVNSDFKATAIGSGRGVQVWHSADQRTPAAPPPETVDWQSVRDVPIVLVTGSNGKTTTVRLLASVVRAWRLTPGFCSTDNVVIGSQVVETGDWSGPMGARAVLRDPRVDVAILETARGGILRRGLAVSRADAAIVTNIAADHFGEWGVHDLAGIARAKLVVGQAARRLVINAEDPVLVRHVKELRRQGVITADIGYFALNPRHPVLAKHMAAGGTAAFFDGSDLLFVYRRRATRGAHAADVPVTLGGVARFNIANALGVILLAAAIGVPKDVIAEGLKRFKGTPSENPGRGHLYEVNGAKVLVDFAHNPHGQRALIETAMGMPSKRKIIILGQAGDRDDESIRGLARETWPWRPDRVILKEMQRYLRGRQPGEATGIIKQEFLKLGAPESLFSHADSEFEAVQAALAEAQPGDLVLLPIHAEREKVLQLLEELTRRPGPAVPPLRHGALQEA